MGNFSFNNNESYNNDSQQKQEKKLEDPITVKNTEEASSFHDIPFKDGREITEEGDWDPDREKRAIGDLVGKTIMVTDIKEHKSKESDGTYLTFEFNDENGNKCFTNTASGTIKSQVEEKNLVFPFTVQLEKVRSRKNPNYQYWKLK